MKGVATCAAAMLALAACASSPIPNEKIAGKRAVRKMDKEQD